MLYPMIRRQPNANLWDEMSAMRNVFDRAFGRPDTEVTGAWSPAVDIRETKDELLLHVELPGLASDAVDVSVENGVLTISGEKKQELEEGVEGSEWHMIERRYGRFERRFSLPRSVDPERVGASFSNGVLTVALPKAEKAKPRKIEVKVQR